MAELTLTIGWIGVIETVYLGDSSDLHVGSEVITTEVWKDTKDILRYRARVEGCETIGHKLILRLRYREVDNPEAAMNDYWGLSTITLPIERSGSKSAGTAVWQDDLPDEDRKSGTRKVAVREDKDVIPEGDINLKQILIKTRKQNRFRSELLKIDKSCVVTGESCPHVLDAAHILEVKGLGGFGTGNGFLMRSDIHRLFDYRLLKIDADGRFTLHGAALSASSYLGLAQQLSGDVLMRVRKNLEKRNRADIAIT